MQKKKGKKRKRKREIESLEPSEKLADFQLKLIMKLVKASEKRETDYIM